MLVNACSRICKLVHGRCRIYGGSGDDTCWCSGDVVDDGISVDMILLLLPGCYTSAEN